MLDVRLGSPQQYQHLTVYPLLSGTDRELSYLLLIHAISASLVAITEKGGGTVPTLVARNQADESVLVLDGEQLIGARQNRMTNRSMLLPAHSETEIPVFCMEQGRWHHVSSQMSTKPHMSPANVRRQGRKVEAGYSERGMAASLDQLSAAQGDVWEGIRAFSAKLGSDSASGALDRVYDTNLHSIDSWLPHFPLVPEQVGLLAFVRNQPIGLDLIGGRALYAELHQRFLYGYVMDALTSEPNATSAPAVTAEQYLARVRDARHTPAQTVGAGRYAVLSGTVVGGELTDDEQLVHLSAFPLDERDVAPDHLRAVQPVAPPSRRRRL